MSGIKSALSYYNRIMASPKQPSWRKRQKREYGHAIRDVTLRGSSVDRRDRAEHKYRYANTYDTRADTLVSRHAKTVPVTGDRDGAARVILERDFCRSLLGFTGAARTNGQV